MLLSYLLIFCRAIIIFVFLVSSLGKARNISAFEKAIANFNILPKRFHRISAVLFLVGEFAVVYLVFAGGELIKFGFLLAVILLVLFCIAIVSVLLRKYQIACNCFGASEKIISAYDFWRNAFLIGFAFLGWRMALVANTTPIALGLFEIGLIGAVAAIFLTLLTQFREIVRFLSNMNEI